MTLFSSAELAVANAVGDTSDLASAVPRAAHRPVEVVSVPPTWSWAYTLSLSLSYSIATSVHRVFFIMQGWGVYPEEYQRARVAQAREKAAQLLAHAQEKGAQAQENIAGRFAQAQEWGAQVPQRLAEKVPQARERAGQVVGEKVGQAQQKVDHAKQTAGHAQQKVAQETTK